jgi:hypothetical protein
VRAALSIAACALGAVCFPAVGFAAPPVVSAELAVSAPVYQARPGGQHTAATAWNGFRNKYVVVWVDGNSIRGEFVSTAGARDAPTYSFSIPTTGAPGNLDVAVHSTHMFLIVWEQGGAIWGARVLDDDPLGDPFVISDAVNARNQPASQREPAVATDGTDFLVVWADARRNQTLSANHNRDGFDLYAARVDAAVFTSDLILDDAGFVVAQEGTVTDIGNSDGGECDFAYDECYFSEEQRAPTVAWDGANYLVAWVGETPSAGSAHVRARFVTSGGAVSGAAFAVSDTASPTERNPDMIWNGANSVYFIVWTTGSSGDIVGARINAAGAVLDSPARVFADGPGNQDRARAASNASNSYTVIWDDGADIYGLHAVRVSILGPENWLIGLPQLLAGEVGNDVVPSLTKGDGTNLLAAWTGAQSSTDANLHAKRVNVAGTSYDAAPIVLSTSAGPQELPFLAWNGNYLAAWKERRPPTSPSTHDVYRGRLNAAGMQLDGSGVLTLDDISNTLRPPAMARGEATFLVTWAHDFDVYALRLDAAGTPVGGPITIDAPDYNGLQPQPDVAWNGASYLIVWRYYDGGFNQGIRAKRVSGGGEVLDTAPITVAANGNGVTSPVVASDGGNWLVTWGQLAPGTSRDGFARRVDRDGALLGASPIVVSSAPDEQTPTGVAWDGDRYLVAWEDQRDAGPSTSDVYVGRITEAGTALDGLGIPLATAPGGTGGREVDVVANGENFVVAWRTFANDVRAARITGLGAVLDAGGVQVVGGGMALPFPGLAASSPGRVAVAYARTAPEPLYGEVGRAFVRFFDEDTLPAADSTPPVNPSSLSSSSHPDDTPSNDDTVEVQWSGASDAGSGLDGFSYVWDSVPTTVPPTAKNADDVPSSATSPALATGSWYFHLRTRDKAGNWSAGAVHLGPFVIDVTAPETTITSGPGGTTAVAFTFASSEDGSTFACSLDGGPASSCSSPASYGGLGAGDHTFAVAASDALGNADPTPASASWNVAPPAPPPPGGSALPTLTISNARVKEGNRGTKAMKFFVRLSAPSAQPVTVRFKTQKGTAKPRRDFVGRSLLLTFAPGQVEIVVVVKIKGDRRKEKTEKFMVLLSNAVGAAIADAEGVGTIRDNDP